MGLIAALMVLIGFVVWQVYSADGFSTTFLKDYVAEVLTAGQENVELDVQSITLEWDFDRQALVLTTVAPQLFEQNPQTPNKTIKPKPIATADALTFVFSRQALLTISLRPVSIAIEAPHIYYKDSSNGMASSIEASTFTQDTVATALGMLDRQVSEIYSRLAENDALSDFERLTISNLQVSPKNPDSTNPEAFLITEGDASVRRTNGEIVGQLALNMIANQMTLTADGEGIYDLSDDAGAISLKLKDIDIRRVTDLFELPPDSIHVDGTTDITLGLSFQDPKSDTSDDLQPSAVQEVSFALQSPGLAVSNIPDFDNSLTLSALKLESHYHPETKTIFLDGLRAEITQGDQRLPLSTSGKIDLYEATQPFTVELSLGGVDMENLSSVWPSLLAVNPRAWVTENITSGQAKANLTVNGYLHDTTTGGFGINNLSGTIDFTGGTTKYFRDFPAFTDLSGQAKFDTTAIVITLTQGTANGVILEEGTVELLQLDQTSQMANINLKLGGAVADVIKAIDHPPISFSERYPGRLNDISGTASLTLQVSTPLEKDVAVETVNISIDGLINNLESTSILPDLDLRGGQFFVSLEDHVLRLSGTSIINGATINLEATRTTNLEEAKFTANVEAIIPAESYRDLEFFFHEYIDGVVAMKLNVDAQGDTMTSTVELDLTKAGISHNYTNWTKEIGEPANFTVKVAQDNPDTIQITELSATGPALELNGSGSLTTKDNQLRQLQITRAKIGKTDMRGTYRSDPGDSENPQHYIDLKGSAIDLTGLEKLLEISGLSGTMNIDGAFDQLLFGGPDPLTNATFDLTFDVKTNAILDFILNAETVQSAPINLAIKPDSAGQRQLRLTSKDAGGTLRGLDLFETFRGGTLEMSGQFVGTPPESYLLSDMSIKDFRIVNAPILAQLLSLASLTGLPEALSGEGIAFTNADAKLMFKDGNITVQDFKAFGSTLGITAKGLINREAEQIDLAGTFAPAYTLNKILGNIPFLGQILTGGGREDVFAARYTVKGTPDDPQVAVNPLSALTPGILRGIFTPEPEIAPTP